MILDTFLLADAATATPDGKLFVHGGGITRLTPPSLPWVQPQITVVARLRMEESDWGTPHQILLEILDPAGTPIVPPAPIHIEHDTRPAVIEGEEQFVQMALGIGSPIFTTPGVYSFQLSLNGEVVRSLPVAVAVVGDPTS